MSIMTVENRPTAQKPSGSVPDRVSPSLERNQAGLDLKLLAICLLVATALDLIFFTGFYSSDDISYYEFARYWWLTGEYPKVLLLGGLRLPLVIWDRLMISLVGPNPQAVATTYVVFHLGLIVSCFALARRLFDRPTALLTAYFVALSPPLIHYSTTIMPDTFIAVFTVLSLYCFMRAYDSLSGASRPSALWMILCGLCVGLAYMAKESGLILLPFYFVMWLVFSRGKSWKTAVWVGAMFPLGVFLAMFIEWSVFYYLLGRSFIRLGWMNTELDPATKAHVLRYGLDPVGRFEWACQRINEFYYFVPPILKYVALIFFALYFFVKRSRVAVAAIMLWQFAFLTWGTMSFSEYFPPSIQARYYVPVLPFAIMMIALVITRVFPIVERIESRQLSMGLRILLVSALIYLPLAGLKVCDRKAGKAYRAETIGNVTRALTFAADQDNGPTVLSSYLRHRYKYVYQDQKCDWILNANAIDDKELNRLLDQGPFYYAETSWQPFEPRTLLDSLLHRLVAEEIVLPPTAGMVVADTSFEDADHKSWTTEATSDQMATAYWNAQGDVLGRIQFQGRAAAVVDMGWFTPFSDRMSEIRSYLCHGLLSLKRIDVRHDRQSVRLVRVIPLGSVSNSMDGREGEANGFAESDRVFGNITTDLLDGNYDWTLSSRSESARSRSGADGLPETRLFGGETRSVDIQLKLKEPEYEWLTRGKSRKSNPIELGANALYEFTIETTSESSASAELRLELFDLAGGSRPVLTKRIRLRPGVATFGISTGPTRYRVEPAFKVTGLGRLALKRFEITRLER